MLKQEKSKEKPISKRSCLNKRYQVNQVSRIPMVPQSQDPVHSLRVTLKSSKRPNIKHQTYRKIKSNHSKAKNIKSNNWKTIKSKSNNCKSQLHQVSWGIIEQLICLFIDDRQIGFVTKPNY